MCGICGVSLKPGSDVNIRKVMEVLLEEMQLRGSDATGVAWRNESRPDRVVIKKEPLPARRFLEAIPAEMDSARTVIGHTRAATQGDPKFNRNNHPLVIGKRRERLVGVHNGVIDNDDKIYERLLRDGSSIVAGGECDSEAVFAWLHHKQGVLDEMKQVMGSYAIAWLDEREEKELHLARGLSSPLKFAVAEEGIVFASTAAALWGVREMMGEFEVDARNEEYTRYLEEGSHLVVVGGEIVRMERFEFETKRTYRRVTSGYGFQGEDWEMYYQGFGACGISGDAKADTKADAKADAKADTKADTKAGAKSATPFVLTPTSTPPSADTQSTATPATTPPGAMVPLFPKMVPLFPNPYAQGGWNVV